MNGWLESVRTLVVARCLLWTLALQPVWFVGSVARAAGFVVTATEDEPDAAPGDGACASAAGQCTLRAAVEETNATPGFDSIYLSVANSFELELGSLVISDEVEISGVETRFAILDAVGRSRVFELVPRPGQNIYVRLVALTLRNGFAGASDPRGGAVLSADPLTLLVLERCVVENSYAAGEGGGIFNAGSLELRRSMIRYNGYADGTSEVTVAGGGIFNAGSTSLSRSTIEGNAAVRGAGLANESGRLDSMNTTFGSNRARERGGALFNAPSTAATLAFTTIAENRAGDDASSPLQPGEGGGIFNAGALEWANSIIARNEDLRSGDSPSYAPDCVSDAAAGSVRSRGGLVLGVLSERCAHDAAPSDQRGSAAAPLDPGFVGSYSSPGEETYAYVLANDSVALDAAVAGEGTYCVEEDQWGMQRPSADGGATPRCDSGATELGASREYRKVMLIVGSQEFAPTDVVLHVKLADYGYDVVNEPADTVTEEVLENDLTLISETVTSSLLPSWLFTVPKPILTLEPGTLDELGMTELSWDVTQGVEFEQTTLHVISGEPLGVGFSSPEVAVTDSGAKFAWGVPPEGSDAFTVAELASAPGHWAIFGYEAGAQLVDGSAAPAARVAFFAAEGAPPSMNANGWILFYATMDYLFRAD